MYRNFNGDRRYIACGMSRDSLQERLESNQVPGSGAGALVHLGPESLPEFIQAEMGEITVEPGRFNLLCGDFEPPQAQTARKLLHRSLLIILVICSALIVLGLERRTAAYARKVTQLEFARAALYHDVLSAASASAQPPELRLTAELRRLRQTRQKPSNDDPGSDSQDVDCGPILADLLARWPSDVLMQTESISITPTSIVIRGYAPGSQDVQRLADACNGLSGGGVGSVGTSGGGGWQMQQPQVNASRDNVQASLQFTRAAEHGKGQSP